MTTTLSNPQLEAFLLFEEMLNFNRELEDASKYAIFAELRRQHEEQLLMQEINELDETDTR